jgi:hypothetical protein
MADFVPSDPVFTVSFDGPGGKKEYHAVWERTKDGSTYWSGKDGRGGWVSVSKFVSKEDRQEKKEQQHDAVTDSQTQEDRW